MISAFEWCHPTFTRLAKTWLQKYDKFSASFTDHVRLGYLDVAIAKKICKTCMPTCAIDLRQRLFRCSHRKKIQKFVSETLKKQSQEYFVSESLKKQSQEYFVSESRGAPFECAQKCLGHGCGGQVVSVLTFYSDDLSLNPS